MQIKEDVWVLAVLLLVAVVSIIFLVYSHSIGQAIQMPTIPMPTIPAAQPALPSPTPIPTPRISSTPSPTPIINPKETPKKPDFPPYIAYWLTPGKLTTPGEAIRRIGIKPVPPGKPSTTGPLKTAEEGWIAPSISPLKKPWEEDKEEFNIIRGILNYVKSFNKFKKDTDCVHCFDRDVNDVFVNGISRPAEGGNCGHYALLFVTLARLNGIPAKEIATFQSTWADEQKRNGCWDGTTKGHVYAQVYIDGAWYGVDPMSGTFVEMDEKGNVLNSYTWEQVDKIWAEGRDGADYTQILKRWCYEGYRYNIALNGLPLCKNAKYQPPFTQWPIILACKEPLTSKYKIQLK